MIHVIKAQASKEQMTDMLPTLQTYIKLAVDVHRRVIAGGGALHADCEAALLEDGSQQADVWGADWIPAEQAVRFGALINLRPRVNPTMEIQDPEIRRRVEAIARKLLRGAS